MVCGGDGGDTRYGPSCTRCDGSGALLAEGAASEAPVSVALDSEPAPAKCSACGGTRRLYVEGAPGHRRLRGDSPAEDVALLGEHEVRVCPVCCEACDGDGWQAMDSAGNWGPPTPDDDRDRLDSHYQRDCPACTGTGAKLSGERKEVGRG
jgi:hypothetical protein